jgi:Uma2 family endonuclease
MAEAVRTKITAAEYARLPETNLPTELIDGEIISMPSPKMLHQEVLGNLYFMLRGMVKDGQLFVAPLDVHLDEYNIVQPDIFWVSGPGSRCKLGDDNYWHGAPDLVIEIFSPGTGPRDRREKFQLYEKHGTREYWLVDPGERYVEVWQLVRSQFKRVGVFGADEAFESPLLGGKKVELKAVFESPAA